MSKEKLGNELSYAKIGYKPDRWKWVFSLLPNHSQENVTGEKFHLLDKSTVYPHPSKEDVTQEHLWKCYGLDKLPKVFPCPKRCFQTPWCLGGLRAGGGSGKGGSRVPLSQQLRQAPLLPVGLQNTANTCWINSALQLFFYLPKFRNAVNSVTDFGGDDSLDSLVHLLQVVFAEMEMHPFKAIACEPGSVFERLGMFASREVMKKDANNELLKCVSEFMENTIDWLVAETKLATIVAPMFTISLTRLAKWQCSKCSAVHEYQLSPASCYTMGAYISADQAPLQQCLMDLQAETQTGVMMVCGDFSTIGGQERKLTGGCGASVKVDRVVTPKLGNLPNYLIIRNNSLMAEDVKRRLHVVYPETLDLSEHTLDGSSAHYELAAVIFHHGHWVKHYSAQVKTEGGRWFSFNDESVLEMSFKTAANAQGNPQENHPNYFSLGSVSNKFKSRNGERVSRGAFIWLYTLVDAQPELSYVPPHPAVVEYIAQHRTVKKNDNSELLRAIHGERQDLLKELAVSDVTSPYALLPEWLLLAWLSSQDCRFVAPSRALQQLQDCVCDHGNLRPMLAHAFKCVRMDMVAVLLTHRCGIHLTHEEETTLSPPLSKTKKDVKHVAESVNSTSTSVNIASQSESESLHNENSNSSLNLAAIHRDAHNDSPETTTHALRDLLKREGTKHEAGCGNADSHHEAPATSTSNENGPLPDSCHNGMSHFKEKTESSGGGNDAVTTTTNGTPVESSDPSEVMSSTTPLMINSSSPNAKCQAPTSGLFYSTNRHHEQRPSPLGVAALHSSVISSTTDVPSSGANFLLSDTQISATEATSCTPKALLSGGSLPLLVADGAVLPGAEHQCQECVMRHARHILFLEQLRALHKQCKKEAIKQEQSSYRPIGMQSLELWPKIATRKYMKDYNVDLSFGPENIPDHNPDEEEKSKSNCSAPDSSNGFDDASTTAGVSLNNDNNNRTTSTASGSDGSCDAPFVGRSESPAGGGGANDTLLEEVVGFKFFNEDLVCSHFQLNPQAVKFYIPEAMYFLLVDLCGEDIHPATVLNDFEACQDCQSVLVASESACERGLEEKRRLVALFNERRRPAHGKDRGTVVYLLDRDFFDEWRTFVRGCQRGVVDKRPELTNHDFMCDHKQLQYNPALMDAPRITELWVVLWEDEWATLVELYGPPVGGAVRAVITPDGFSDLEPAVCSAGCVESQQMADYEDQFDYDSALIYVRQVHSPDDIPQRAAANTRSMGPAVTPATVTLPQPLSSTTQVDPAAVISNGGFALEEERAAVNGNEALSPSPMFNGDGDKVTINGASDCDFSNRNNDGCSGSANSGMTLCTSDNSGENGSEVASVSKRPLDSPVDESSGPRKIPRLTPSQEACSSAAMPSRASGRKRGARGASSQSKGTASKSLNPRLVRASKSFASTDTIRQVQNFIAERTSVWPMLQTVWLGWSEDLATVLSLPSHDTTPVLLQEEHLTRTLGALRVRPGDTIYFKAAKEDMEKAAGDGIVEYDELPA